MDRSGRAERMEGVIRWQPRGWGGRVNCFWRKGIVGEGCWELRDGVRKGEAWVLELWRWRLM